jgi:AcrR family transcriptional regulator
VTTETARRTQIEDAASTLFRERGYPATSVRDIAQALNIQGPSLYAHVSSKEDVLWSIVKRAADRFNAEVGPHAAANARAPARLRAMIRAHVAVVTASQRDAAVFLHEWRFLSPERRDDIGQRRDRYEKLFRDVIADGMRAGEFAEVDPRLTAMAILAALNGIATWFSPSGSATATEIADRYAELFIRALREDHFMTRTFS